MANGCHLRPETVRRVSSRAPTFPCHFRPTGPSFLLRSTLPNQLCLPYPKEFSPPPFFALGPLLLAKCYQSLMLTCHVHCKLAGAYRHVRCLRLPQNNLSISTSLIYRLPTSTLHPHLCSQSFMCYWPWLLTKIFWYPSNGARSLSLYLSQTSTIVPLTWTSPRSWSISSCPTSSWVQSTGQKYHLPCSVGQIQPPQPKTK